MNLDKFKDAILFCGRDKDIYPWLSNFYIYPLIDDKGRIWKSSEHYYQALKFECKLIQEEIRKVKSPKEAKQMAHIVAPIGGRRDWLDVRLDMMRLVLRRKFADSQLSTKLKETKGKYLIEHAHWDSFWGSGEDMNGQNWMGKLLMEIRDE